MRRKELSYASCLPSTLPPIDIFQQKQQSWNHNNPAACSIKKPKRKFIISIPCQQRKPKPAKRAKEQCDLHTGSVGSKLLTWSGPVEKPFNRGIEKADFFSLRRQISILWHFSVRESNRERIWFGKKPILELIGVSNIKENIIVWT